MMQPSSALEISYPPFVPLLPILVAENSSIDVDLHSLFSNTKDYVNYSIRLIIDEQQSGKVLYCVVRKGFVCERRDKLDEKGQVVKSFERDGFVGNSSFDSDASIIKIVSATELKIINVTGFGYKPVFVPKVFEEKCV